MKFQSNCTDEDKAAIRRFHSYLLAELQSLGIPSWEGHRQPGVHFIWNGSASSIRVTTYQRPDCAGLVRAYLNYGVFLPGLSRRSAQKLGLDPSTPWSDVHGEFTVVLSDLDSAFARSLVQIALGRPTSLPEATFGPNEPLNFGAYYSHSLKGAEVRQRYLNSVSLDNQMRSIIGEQKGLNR